MKKIKLLLAITLLAGFSSCTTDSIEENANENTKNASKIIDPDNPPPLEVPIVYAAGFDKVWTAANPNQASVATIWIDDYALAIGDPSKESNAFSVVANALGDYYVVGRERDTPTSINIAKLWRNDTTINLTDGTRNSIAASVCIKNITGNVYIGGNDGPDGKVWDSAGNVVYTFANSFVNGVFAIGSDIYACGTYQTGPYTCIAKVWKNGIDVTNTYVGSTPAGTNSFATSVSVYGTTVFVTGSYGTMSHEKATVWKNGVATYLTLGSFDARGTSVHALSATTYFVAGYEYDGTKRVAKVWKNGTSNTTLSSGTNNAYATSVFATSATNYYVGGLEQDQMYANFPNVGKIWKNGFEAYSTVHGYSHAINSVYVK